MLSLPMSPNLSDAEIEYVCAAVAGTSLRHMPPDHSTLRSSARPLRLVSRQVARLFAAQTPDRNAPPDATKEAARPLRVAQIVAAANHSPWFTNICFEMARRGFEIVAIIDSSEGDLAGRLAAGGIRHYKVPMYFGRNLDRAACRCTFSRFHSSSAGSPGFSAGERMDIAHSHIFVANFAARIACLFAGTRHVAGIAGAAASRGRGHARSRPSYLLGGRHDRRRLRVHRISLPPPRSRRRPPLPASTMARRRRISTPLLWIAKRSAASSGISPDMAVVGLVAHFYPPTRGPQRRAPRAVSG